MNRAGTARIADNNKANQTAEHAFPAFSAIPAFSRAIFCRSFRADRKSYQNSGFRWVPPWAQFSRAFGA